MLTKAASRKRAQREYPTLPPCQRCGRKENVQRHHPNLDDALCVEFLCQKCHTTEHLTSGSWGCGPKRAKICTVCGKEFMNYTHTRVKTCGPKCLSEIGRINAYKRWRTEPTDLEALETPSCRKSQSGLEGESCFRRLTMPCGILSVRKE